MKTRILFLFITVLLSSAYSVKLANAQDTRESGDFKLAVRLYNDGLFAQAEEQFKSFIQRFPTSASAVEARLYLGLLQKQARKYGEAKATLQDFALRHSDHPKAPDAWWNLAEVYAAEHNYGEAGEAFAKLKAFHPRSPKAPEALLEASTYFLKAGDTENARTVLNAVLLEYPRSDVRAEAQFALGRLFLASGDAERALREFRRLQTETITSGLRARTIAAIGETNMQLGNRTEAEARLREVINTWPKSEAAREANVVLGDLQLKFREYDAAERSYRNVADDASASLEFRLRAFVGLADVAAARNDHAAAVTAYENMFRMFPRESIEPAIVRKAATAARQAGDHVLAQRYLETLVNDTLLSVDRRVLIANLGEIARDGRSFAAAVSWYRRYLQQFPDDAGAPFALLRIAEINEQDFRNYSEALVLYSSVIERYGLTRVADNAQYARARVFEAQGREHLAADAYSQLLAQYPASDFSDDATRRLSVLRNSSAESNAGNMAIERLTAAIAALQEQSGGGQVDLLLGQLYLDELRDYSRAIAAFDAAARKGVTGADAELASWGAAMAAVRQAKQSGQTAAEAERRCGEFFTRHATSDKRDILAWELFELQRSSGVATDILDAASRYLALRPSSRREEARIMYAEALATLGRNEEADKEFTAVIDVASAATPSADAWFGRAKLRANMRRFEDALRDLVAYESNAPDGRYAADALMLRGRLLERTGRYGEAVEVYQRAADRFLYSALFDSARIASLEAMAAGGDAQLAVARALRFMRDVESNPFLGDELVQEYRFAHAATLARARDRSAARLALLRYLDEHPNGRHIGEVFYALGQMYRDEGKVDLASSYLQQASELQQGGGALRAAADLLLESGRYDGAISQYERLAATSDNEMEQMYARSRIVVALYRAGRLQDADRAAAEFPLSGREARPAQDEFKLEKGKHFFRQGDYRKAMDLFDDVEGSRTEELAAYGLYWQGRTLEAQSRNNDAIKKFDAVGKKYTNTAAAIEALMALGRMNMRAERFVEASAQFKAVADAQHISESMLKEALNGLIRCYEELNMVEAAAEMTKRFVDAYPSDPTAFRKHVNLGVYYYKLSMFDIAISHLENLLSEANPDDQAEIRYYIGESYFYKSDFNQAALEFLKVPYLVIGKTEIDWTAASYYMAGQSYEKLSRYELALDLYRKIVDTPGIDARFKAQAEKEIHRVRALID